MGTPEKNHRDWQVEQLSQQAIVRISALVKEASYDYGNPSEAIFHAIDQVAHFSNQKKTQLAAFWFALEALELSHEFGILKSKEKSKLILIAEKLLRTMKIIPGKSSLDAIHNYLATQVAYTKLDEGNPKRALWEFLERTAKIRHESPDQYTHRVSVHAELLNWTGSTKSAIEVLLHAGKVNSHETSQRKILTQLIPYYRTIGAFATAHQLVENLNEQLKDATITFEKYFLEALEMGHLGNIISAVSPKGPCRSGDFLLTTKLLTYATNATQWVDRLPKSDSIRRQFDTEFSTAAGQQLLKITEAIETSYDTTIPLEIRINRLGEFLNHNFEKIPPDMAMLTLGASARFLVRARQLLLAENCIARLRSVALEVTNGTTDHVWPIFEDLSHKSWAGKPQTLLSKQAPQPTSIKTSWTARTFELSKLSTSLGFKAIEMQSQLALASFDQEKKQQIRSAYTEEIATILVKYLSKMRAGLMKFGQIVGLLIKNPSEETQTLINQLFENATPMPVEDAEAAITRSLNLPANKVFSDWDPRPVAAGSIGQVHRATLPSGEDVAVKILYPGIKKALSADLFNLRVLKSILKTAYPRAKLDELYLEIENIFQLECDYKNEEKNLIKFRDSLIHDDIKVPQVFPKFSATDVLTMEFVDGEPLTQFMKTATQEQKNWVGRVLYEGHLRAIFKHGLIYSDIQPGNFIIKDKKIWIVDFGNLRILSQDWVTKLRKIVMAILANDADLLRDAFIEAGFVVDPENYPFAEHLNIIRQASGAGWVEDRPFIYNLGHIRDDVYANVVKHPMPKNAILPADLLFFNRGALHFQLLLTQLNAEANWHRILLNVLEINDQPEGSATTDQSDGTAA